MPLDFIVSNNEPLRIINGNKLFILSNMLNIIFSLIIISHYYYY